MTWHVVTTQAEMDAAIAANKTQIEIAAQIAIDIRVPDGLVLVIKAVAGAIARVFSGHVEARGSSHVEARGSSHVEARGSSHVEAWESSHVEAWGSSHVEAWESSHVEAWGSSHVEAWGSSHVEAWGSSHVEARGSSHVEARGSSHVEARESSHVEARESSHVEARAAVALSIFGSLVKAKASSKVAVHLHDKASCEGGVQIQVTRPQTALEWCEWYGVAIDGNDAILFKGLNDNFTSLHNAIYKPGTTTEASDWDGGKIECGCGLHFSPSPGMTRKFATGATKFVACRVPIDSIAVHPNGDYPNKVKAPRCWNWYECDRDGNVIGAKFDPPQAAVKKSKPKASRKRKPRRKVAARN